MTLPAELTPENVVALLKAQGREASHEEVASIFEFVRQVGSLEKARQAVEAVEEIRRAA
jgi:hypothetical protein